MSFRLFYVKIIPVKYTFHSYFTIKAPCHNPIKITNQ